MKQIIQSIGTEVRLSEVREQIARSRKLRPACRSKSRSEASGSEVRGQKSENRWPEGRGQNSDCLKSVDLDL